MKGSAKRLTRCAANGCARQPSPMLCVKHLAKVSAPTRVALGRAWWALRGRGKQDLPKHLVDLLTEAIRDINRPPFPVAREVAANGEVKT